MEDITIWLIILIVPYYVSIKITLTHTHMIQGQKRQHTDTMETKRSILVQNLDLHFVEKIDKIPNEH